MFLLGFKDQISELASDPVKWKKAMKDAESQLKSFKARKSAGNGENKMEESGISVNKGEKQSGVGKVEAKEDKKEDKKATKKNMPKKGPLSKKK